jgi:Rrf2 family protein
MTRLDYIEAIKGAQGGYRLKAILDSVSLADFIESMEGPIGMVDCNIKTDCSQIKLCNIRLPIKKINDNIHSLFSNIKLSDITCGTSE